MEVNPFCSERNFPIGVILHGLQVRPRRFGMILLRLSAHPYVSSRIPVKASPVMTRVRVLSTLERRKEEKDRIDIERLHTETRFEDTNYVTEL